MTTVDEYVDGVKDFGTAISGKSAPHTGYYYTQIYGESSAESGIPTLYVTREDSQGHPIAVTTSVPMNDLSDEQILQMIQNGQQIEQNTTANPSPIIEQNPQGNSAEQSIEQQDANLPWGSIFLLALLLVAVAFVYAIIRIWQDHQAQKIVLASVKNPYKDSGVENIPHAKKVESEPINSTPNWRNEIRAADDKLKRLLAEKGIKGDTVSDQLKVVGAGQFTSLDIAWEAHQSAEKLLNTHDLNTHDPAIQRTLRLFNQVFADHGVI